MRPKIKLGLSCVAVLLAVTIGTLAYVIPWRDSAAFYQPQLELDPIPPAPPEWARGDFDSFLARLHAATESDGNSLLLHEAGLSRAEEVFRNTAGVPDELRIEMHAPFYTVDPESIFALYHDLPALERGQALYQQHCSVCHGPYGRGNGPATREWYTGNYPRNFWYGKYKSRTTEYGTLPTDFDLYRTLTRGLYGSTMPSFRHLSERDRWSLVQFIKSLATFYDEFDETVVNLFDPRSKPFLPHPLEIEVEPPVTLESVTRGRILFIEQGCVSCHQEKKAKPVGLGRSEGNFNWYDEMNRPIQHSRDLTTGVFRAGAAASDVYRIISGGPNLGPMPNYLKLPVQDRWALVHYVRSVYKRDYPQAPASADAQAHLPTAPPQP
ncbi:MAG: cytochrome c [Pirellulales bacterium]